MYVLPEKRRFSKLLSVTLALLILGSAIWCAIIFAEKGKEPGRAEIAVSLREQYPYARNIPDSGPLFSARFPEKDAWLTREDFVFRAEVTGEWESCSLTSGAGEIDACLLPVKVTEWLDGREGVPLPGDELLVAFSSATFDFGDAGLFPAGSSFVICGSRASGLPEYGGLPLVAAEPLFTFYVTGEEVILSLDKEPAMDEYSGFSYEEFKSLLRNVTENSGWHDAARDQGDSAGS